MSTELKLDTPGTLPRPGPLGRLIRLAWGILITYYFVNIITNSILALDGSRALVGTNTPTHPVFWAIVLAWFLVTPYVINIGFSMNWGRKPQFMIAGIAAVLIAVSYFTNGTAWSPALGWFIYIWFAYVSGHLGISFLLSAVLATPGCEMRAIPHLYTVLTGNQTKEHYCPGHIDAVDKWEAKRRNRRVASGDSNEDADPADQSNG